jgi:hypothetical protein
VKRCLFFLSISMLGLLWSCRESSVPERKYSFYYRQPVWQPDALERRAVEQATGGFLLLRFFEVERVAGEVMPVDVMTGVAQADWTVPVVPVIHISNSVWEHMSREELVLLAERIYASAGFMCKTFAFTDVLSLHFDSDWTPETRNTYFDFLAYFAELTGLSLSVTVRLHQLQDLPEPGLAFLSRIDVLAYDRTAGADVNDSMDSAAIAQLEAALPIIKLMKGPLNFILPIAEWSGKDGPNGASAVQVFLESKLDKDFGYVFEPLEAQRLPCHQH